MGSTFSLYSPRKNGGETSETGGNASPTTINASLAPLSIRKVPVIVYMRVLTHYFNTQYK